MTPPTTSEPPHLPAVVRPRGPLAFACFLGGELLLLAATHFYGGPPWTLLMMIALLAQVAGGVRLAPLALLAPSLAWLAAHRVTGNRELFFPFAMHLATFVAVLGSGCGTWLGFLGGGGVVAAFLAIRASQEASPRVLAVESAVALAILVIAVTTHVVIGRRAVAIPAIVILSSLAAYAALSL